MSVVHVETDEFGEIEVADATGLHLSAGEVAQVWDQMAGNRALIASLTRWQRKVQQPRRRGGLLDRDRYLVPNNVFDLIRTARSALDDDVVDGVKDLTEALAFKKVAFFSPDEDEENAWNQWAGTVNLDSVLRTAWHTYYTDSQVVFATWWGRKTYRVQGTTARGNERRKSFELVVPTAIDVIDTLKVTPVGDLLFGRERLAYIATMGEAEAFDEILAGRNATMRRTGRFPGGAPLPRSLPIRWDDEPSLDNEVVERLLVARYVPDGDEARLLMADGVDPNHLFLMSKDAVFRHTATKAGYERFARPRMKSALEVLDMKHQLRQKDRVFLVAGINFILVIKQGSDQQPALPEEIAHLRANTQLIAQMPVVVGPHTLTVEIVTPDMASVIDRDKWDTIDDRLISRLLRQFGPRKGGDTKSEDLAQLVGLWLENERHMLNRTLERNVFELIAARNPSLAERAKLRFYPKRIALAFDQAYASFLLDMRERNEVSRDTVHTEFGLSQADEAAMREREEKKYDDTFKTLATPGAGPAGGGPGGGAPAFGAPPPEPSGGGGGQGGNAGGRAAQKQAGRAGGRAGGAAPGSGQGQAPRRMRKLSASSSRTALLAAAKELEIPGRTAMNRQQLATAIHAEIGDDGDDD